jgi:ABC-type Fe3+-siderophore transport system permease subunit
LQIVLLVFAGIGAALAAAALLALAWPRARADARSMLLWGFSAAVVVGAVRASLTAIVRGGERMDAVMLDAQLTKFAASGFALGALLFLALRYLERRALSDR